MIIILFIGNLEFECYNVRFNSSIFKFYFLLVYFSSCVIHFRIEIQSWIHIYNMFNFYDCLKIWTIKSSLQCNILTLKISIKVYKIQSIYFMFGQKMGWVV
jgi:hypothetical protein